MTGTAAASASASASTSERLISLDAFRGFTIASMVLVNNPGDWEHIYTQLGHAKWDGWTFTDWVFPFFLFICGVSMAFALGRRAKAGADRLSLIWKLGKRAAIIFGIGFLLNFIPYFNFETVRIPGVLQRIAICTLLAAPIVVYLGWLQQALWIVVLLAIYTALMLWLPVPDVAGNIAAGALEPGRDVGAFVDRYVLGGHLWVTSKTWDPEGLLSTIPALCSQLFGVLTGHWLLINFGNMSKQTKAGWMLIAGLVCLIIGSAIDATFMPINKSLWSTSFCIFMTGWALLIFSAFYWLIDASNVVLIRKKATEIFLPLTIYGMNALFIFALSGLIAKLLGFIKVTALNGTLMPLKSLIYAPFKTLPLSLESQSLLFALLFNTLMFLVAWWMWKKKWFVKA